MNRWLAALAGALFLVSGGANGQAASFPDRPVRVIVPFSAGGGTDIIARVVAQKMTERWGQPVVVENRTGANGNIGARLVSQAKPDGYTILGGSSALTINLLLDGEAGTGYKLSEFTPIMLFATAAYVLVVNPKAMPNVRTVKEFIEYAKAQDGGLAWASTSEGNAEHLAGMLFQHMAGIKMRHIPYKGGADAVKDVVGGHVPVGMISVPTSLPYLASGQLRGIGVTDTRRAPQLPDMPTIAESGVPGYELVTWYAAWTTAGTPEPIVDKIHEAMYAALKQEDVNQRVLGIGFNPAAGTRAEFAQFVKQQSELYGKVVQIIGPKKEK